MDSSIAAIAAALNSAHRSEIGDWRQGTYTVRLLAEEIEEAHLLAKHLQHLAAAEVRTTVHYNQKGDPDTIWVNLYDKEGQKTLLNTVGTALNELRRKTLEELVLSRGPIPDSLLERIWNVHQRGWSNARIAKQMNSLLEDEPAVIAGVRMRQWTPNKIANAIKQYLATQNEIEEAA